MSSCAIMQPTYLPWLGYFSLMDQVDQFVFLDNVQFSRQSWQQRNRVKTQSGRGWLTVPVYHKGKGKQCISKVRINEQTQWATKHYKTLQHCYHGAPYWDTYQPWLESIYESHWEKLCELNCTLIYKLAGELGIQHSTILKASALKPSQDRLDRVVSICKQVNADVYISPLGASGYIGAGDSFRDAGIEVHYQNYVHPEYPQLHGNFVPHLSVLDLLLNTGPRSLEILRSGSHDFTEARRKAQTLGSQTESTS